MRSKVESLVTLSLKEGVVELGAGEEVVGVRVGEWIEKVWYVGKGIGASVRI